MEAIIFVDEVNLHENLTTPKFSNVHETTSDWTIYTRNFSAYVDILQSKEMTGQFSKEMITFC